MVRVSCLSGWSKLAIIPLAGILAACGGGGSSSSGDDTTAVTGSVVAAPVDGASVVAKDTSGNTVAGPVTTASDGTYTIQIPNASLASALVLESSGGTFDDEATGWNRSAGALAAHIAGGSLSAGSSVHVTPASTIVRDLVATHSMTLSAAQTAFESAFGFAVDTSTAPVDATDTTAVAGATDAEQLAGLRAAVFSQLTMDLGLNVVDQFDLLPALAADLANGSLDGMGDSGAVAIPGSATMPVDIQNQFGQAMVNFREGNDATDLDNTEIGAPPFAKVALSSSYKVEYVPGMMAAMEGKTMFQVRISNKADDTVATGLSVSLMPMMHMASMNHASPTGGCSETATLGTYSCTMYYLMGSSMSGGMSMGYWQLKVMIGGMMGESVTFSPSVMMAMGDTAKATLKGQADMIAGMPDPMKRSYYLFKEDLSGMMDNRTFDLFIAARESMMSFPAVSVDTVLNTGTAYELTANPMTVEVSSDASTWVAAADQGNGHWSATGIAGLVDDMAGTIYVRLTINGEQKTTDGLATDGSNNYASFTVTQALASGGMGGM